MRKTTANKELKMTKGQEEEEQEEKEEEEEHYDNVEQRRRAKKNFLWSTSKNQKQMHGGR